MSQQQILSVSELTQKVRFILESELNTIWLTGEISNLVMASSGHWYLSLKDNRSQVRCAMFKNANRRVRIRPVNGQQVLVRAKVSLYEPRGDFQLIIEQLEDAGDGLLRQQYEQLKQQLMAEGLFDSSHKKPLPASIHRVGVVTSATGAAIKDILAVLKRRNPSLAVIIYPALVQGQSAASDIAKQITIANQRNEVDVLLVGRGGGSLEDLWSFNEEIVVRAIFQSHLPIVSCVGHEIDTSLADFAADIRAATPSAAAELISKDQHSLQKQLIDLTTALKRSYANFITRKKQNWRLISLKLQHLSPHAQLQRQAQNLDYLHEKLTKAIHLQLQNKAAKYQTCLAHFKQVHPEFQLAHYQQKQQNLSQRLAQAIIPLMQNKRLTFTNLLEQLNMLSPLATLARGYAVLRNDKSKIIASTAQLKAQQSIVIQLKDGEAQAKVESIRTHE